MKKQITILTATYNRARLLCDLYNSLCRQSLQTFDWIIIDDGSQDNTKEIVEKWLTENHAFSIEYRYIPNGGKNRAINYGVKMVKTPYTMIVDSDDYLTDDAIEYLTPKAIEILNDKNLAGISALRGENAETPLKNNNIRRDKFIVANNLERKKYNLERDACEVYKTHILREHPFEVWPGEKFVPEEIVWNKIALEGYSLRWYNKVTCIVRYQEEGLTKGSFTLLRNNPMGYANMYNQRIALSNNFKNKLNNAMQMVALAFYAKKLHYLKESNNKFITAIALLPGIALGIRRKLQF